jgi:hypothetical protein
MNHFTLAALFAFIATSATAQVLPSPPHSSSSTDGVNGAGLVHVVSTAHGGTGGFVDVPAYKSCRFVVDGLKAGNDEMIPIDSLSNWQTWLADPGQGDTATICCRPAVDTLCVGAAGGTVTATINGGGVNGYGIVTSTGSATATCTDQWGKTYQDTRSYTCGQTVSGIAADGVWNKIGGDTDSCSPNAHVTTGGCSVTCGGGRLYQTVYDSCGNVTSQGYNGAACNTQSCCTANWQQTDEGCDAACGGSGNIQYLNHDANDCPGDADYYSYGAACSNSNPATCSYSPANSTGGTCSVGAAPNCTETCAATCDSGYSMSGSGCSGTCVADTCNPSTVLNGTVGAYPGCTITCNSGYTLSGSSCLAASCTNSCGTYGACNCPGTSSHEYTQTTGGPPGNYQCVEYWTCAGLANQCQQTVAEDSACGD